MLSDSPTLPAPQPRTFITKSLTGEIETRDTATGQLLSSTPAPLTPFQYSPELADLVCQRIIEGVLTKDLHLEKGMPSLLLLARWRKEVPEFDALYRWAKRTRAELLRDEALETARAANGESERMVAGIKLAVDTMKWAAEKDDPETFGNRTKVEGTLGVMQLIVDTGIRRTPPTNVTPPPKPLLPPDEDEPALDATSKSPLGESAEANSPDTPQSDLQLKE